MKQRTWVILGASSVIAEEFARLAAKAGHRILLVGRDKPQLDIIAADISLRYHVHCDVILADFASDISQLLHIIEHQKNIDLFIGYSRQYNNDNLNNKTIQELTQINITSTIQLIHAYWHKKQKEHHLLFVSSVSACRGRAKNSLYGASKAAIEIFLQGLQQSAGPHQHISIARLGFIDTHATYGRKGIFYASPAKACAKACWQAIKNKKRCFYHPWFWFIIMTIIRHIPFFVYRRMGKL